VTPGTTAEQDAVDSPHRLPASLPIDSADRAWVAAQDSAFFVIDTAVLRAANPSAEIVRIPNADHNVIRSNEDEVLQDVDAFITRLPK
jgi:pimeloyl-ACP methyl ester carboxylesterase